MKLPKTARSRAAIAPKLDTSSVSPPQKHIVIDARIRLSSTGRYVDRLLEHLQKIDTKYRYTVLTQPDDPWQPSATNFSRLDSPYPQFSFNPMHQIGFARQLYRLKADLVSFPMNQQPLLYFGPVVTSTMDLTMLRFTRAGRHSAVYHAVRMAAYRFLFWYSLRKSRAIITITNFVKKDLEKHYPFTKGHITVTYCASEPPLEVQAKTPEALKTQDKERGAKSRELGVEERFIMHVGSPFPHKNIERLVEAFRVLKKSHPELLLVLAGKKEYYFKQLEKNVNNDAYADDIIITGFIADEELKWLYQNAVAYVLPSLSEGFGLPGLEAMAHGCPVVSSNVTCLPEVYGDAAVYFDPTNIHEIATRIDEVISSQKVRKKLIRKGYSQLKKYSWRRMAQQTLAIYEKVLRG